MYVPTKYLTWDAIKPVFAYLRNHSLSLSLSNTFLESRDEKRTETNQRGHFSVSRRKYLIKVK
jgi:hypothetical protein